MKHKSIKKDQYAKKLYYFMWEQTQRLGPLLDEPEEERSLDRMIGRASGIRLQLNAFIKKYEEEYEKKYKKPFGAS